MKAHSVSAKSFSCEMEVGNSQCVSPGAANSERLHLLDHLLGCHNKREQATFLENHGLQHLFPDWVLLIPPPQHSHYLT